MNHTDKINEYKSRAINLLINKAKTYNSILVSWIDRSDFDKLPADKQALSLRRMSICMGTPTEDGKVLNKCEYSTATGAQRIFNDIQKAIGHLKESNKIGDSYRFGCSLCSCNLVAKTTDANQKCPKGKW